MGGGASTKQLQETSDQLRASKAEAKELQTEKEAAAKKLREAEAREAEKADKLKGLETTLASREKELEDVKAELTQSKSQVKALEQQLPCDDEADFEPFCDDDDLGWNAPSAGDPDVQTDPTASLPSPLPPPTSTLDLPNRQDIEEHELAADAGDAPPAQPDADAAAISVSVLPVQEADKTIEHATKEEQRRGGEAVGEGQNSDQHKGSEPPLALPGAVPPLPVDSVPKPQVSSALTANSSPRQPSKRPLGAIPTHKQSVSLADVVKFFKESVGDLWWEAPRSADLLPRPHCTTSRLAQVCARWNSAHRMQIAARRTSPHSPDFLGILKLALAPILRRQRAKMTVAELWGCSSRTEPASVYVCHSWHENFGSTLEALLTFFLRTAALKEPGLDFEKLEAAALQVRFYSAGFCEVPTGHRSQQDSVEPPIRSALLLPSITSAVVVVDSSAAIFSESWCQLELLEAWKAEKNIVFLANELGCRSQGMQVAGSSFGRPPRELVKFMLNAALEADLDAGSVFSMAEVEEVKAYVEKLGGAGIVNAVFKAAVTTWLLPLLAQVHLMDELRTALSAGARTTSSDFRGISAVTLAAAAHGEGSEQVSALLSSGGDKGAGSLAHDVTEMFDDDYSIRDKAIQKVKATLSGSVGVVRHADAVHVAEREHADRVIRGGLSELKSGEPEKRRSALKRFAALGTLAKAQLRLMSELVKDADPAVREAAAEVVAATGETMDLLQEPDPKVRSIALKTLTARGPGSPQELLRQGPILVKLLGDPDWIVRHSSLHALAQFGAAASPYAGPVAQCLNDQQWYVRHAALLVLGKMPNEAREHHNGIAACLGDGEKEVRKAAGELLEKLGISK